jgi:hypothetical protein
MRMPSRFRGPPQSANGGYACGAVAALLAADDVETTLRAPPPVDRELATEVTRDRAVVRDGDALIAEAVATNLDDFVGAIPAPVSFADAERATTRFPAFTSHPLPSCFVCGPERAAGDGLRILPGAVEGRDVAAAPWIPEPSLGDANGFVRPEIVWAALDCPSYFGYVCFQERMELALLGRLAARIVRRPRVGDRCIAAGWFLSREGRKLTCGSVLWDDHGAVLAFGRALWVVLK